MKYTNWISQLLTLSLATFLGTGQMRAQSGYMSATPSYSDSSAAATESASSTDNLDDPQSAIITLHARVNEVNVLFIATDKHGKFVRDLNQNDFSILDDHKPPQAILNFRRETDLPLHLGLLVDVSGSVGSRFDFEQDAATSFMQHTLRAGFDKAFVLGFNSHQQLAQDFTDNVSLLSAGVHKLHDGGGTALYDAVYRACKEKFLKDRPDRPGMTVELRVEHGPVRAGDEEQCELDHGAGEEDANRSGCDGVRIEREEDFQPALDAALASGRPSLIEVMVSGEESWEKVASSLRLPG